MTYYIGAMAVGSNDILHYGVKGMKWGVRRYEYDGARGLRRRHAVRVASRLQQVNADNRRISRMSERQKESLKRATTYWDERARGKKPTIKRGIIRRSYDAYRSHSFKERVGTQAAVGAGQITYAAIVNKIMKKNVGINFLNSKDYAQMAINGISTSAISLGQDEVLNILFGHF